jgi:TRAP transporter TAXI family solute receptor
MSVGGRLRRMFRHPLLIAIGVILAGTGIAVVVSYIQSKPVTLNIAVGPRQSDDAKLVQSLAQYLARERAPVRLNVIRQDGPQNSAEALDSGAVDLAVVRRDVAMPKIGQVVAVHRRNVAVLIVPPAEAAPATVAAKTAPGKGAAAKKASAAKKAASKTAASKIAAKDEAKPIEKIEDLYGKTIAVVGRSRANITLLNTILGQYGVPEDKITTLQFSTEDLTAQLKTAKFDALLAVGPIGSKVTAEAVTALARGKEPPVFLEIGSSEAIEQQNPVFEATEIPAGAFGGSRPAEAVETIGVSHYIVARRSLDDGIVGNFTKWLFNAKQAQGGDFPAFTKLESPDTDKAATLAVHPGALAYFEGEQKGFFERYSEAMYWGLMLISFFGSGAAWLVSYARSTPSKFERRNDLEALIAVVRRARIATAEELDLMGIEIDDIVERAIRQIESGEIQHNRSSAVTLAADQARRAIGERRTALMKACPVPDAASSLSPLQPGESDPSAARIG